MLGSHQLLQPCQTTKNNLIAVNQHLRRLQSISSLNGLIPYIMRTQLHPANKMNGKEYLSPILSHYRRSIEKWDTGQVGRTSIG